MRLPSCRSTITMRFAVQPVMDIHPPPGVMHIRLTLPLGRMRTAPPLRGDVLVASPRRWSAPDRRWVAAHMCVKWWP